MKTVENQNTNKNEDTHEKETFVANEELSISVQGFVPLPLTTRESEIALLIKSIPNDMSLGRAIRQYYHQYLKQP